MSNVIARGLGPNYKMSAVRAFINHPAGPRTIHFWAPTFKWGLVIAGIADIARPAQQLSMTQSGALAATGTIWSRYSLVITPKNWNLFSVNMFVAMTGYYQLSRIYNYRKQLEQDATKVNSSPANNIPEADKSPEAINSPPQ